MRRIAAPRSALSCLALVVLVGTGACAGSVSSPQPASDSVPSATPSHQPTPLEPSSTPSPTAAPTDTPTPSASVFTSPFYGYSLTLPPGMMTRNWRPAERAWDGEAKLERAGPYLDRTGIAEGGLFLYGAEDPGLDTWFARVEGNGRRFHACTEAENRRDVTINDVPAIAFTQHCALDTRMARVAIWKDGYGIALWLGETQEATLLAARDLAIELLDGLEWIPG